MILRRALGVIAAVIVVAFVFLPLGAAGSGPFPDPSASPPGANNWNCRPNREHPRPVVLLHGLFSTAGGAWSQLSPTLAAHGYCVFSLTYGVEPSDPYAGGVTRMEDSTPEVAAFVARVLAATHARQVDLVAHSEGTLVAQYYLKFLGGSGKVGNLVGLAPIYHGSTTWGTTPVINALEARSPQLAATLGGFDDATCPACAEFGADSPFLRHLYADGVYAVGTVRYTSIMTHFDELVTPYTSGRIDSRRATNIVVQDQCSVDFADHLALIWDPIALQDVLNALDPSRATPPPCQPVAPAVGTSAAWRS